MRIIRDLLKVIVPGGILVAFVMGNELPRAEVEPLQATTILLQLALREHPLTYQDGPLASLHWQALQRCDSLLVLLESRPLNREAVLQETEGLIEKLKRIRRFAYRPRLPQQESTRIQINYFSSGS